MRCAPRHAARRLAADIFRYFGGLASELKGATIPLGEHVLSYTRREPLSVVGAIIPWNAPVLLGTLKIATALCAGNTLVLKAAEDAPLGAEACQEFLPPGVLNVLTGLGPECGSPLAQHPKVMKLSFTGSTEVGKVVTPMSTTGASCGARKTLYAAVPDALRLRRQKRKKLAPRKLPAERIGTRSAWNCTPAKSQP